MPSIVYQNTSAVVRAMSASASNHFALMDEGLMIGFVAVIEIPQKLVLLCPSVAQDLHSSNSDGALEAQGSCAAQG